MAWESGVGGDDGEVLSTDGDDGAVIVGVRAEATLVEGLVGVGVVGQRAGLGGAETQHFQVK